MVRIRQCNKWQGGRLKQKDRQETDRKNGRDNSRKSVKRMERNDLLFVMKMIPMVKQR